MLNVNQSISLKNTTKFNSAWCHVVSQINTFFYAATTGSRSSHRRFSVKKMFLKILQISQENTCVGVVQGMQLY